MLQKAIIRVRHRERVIKMKKTEYITYRTDKEIKDILTQIANEKKWSISQLSEEIIRQWLAEHHQTSLNNESCNKQ